MKKIYNTEFKSNKIFLATQLGIALLAVMSSGAYAQGLGGEADPEPPNIDFSAIDDIENRDMYTNINTDKNSLITGNNNGNQYGGQGTLVVQVDDGFAAMPILDTPNNGASSYGTVDTSAVLAATANNILLETNQNRLTITENTSIIGNAYGGHTAVTVGTGMAFAGDIESAFSIASAKANAYTSAYADDSILSANNNILTVSAGSTVTGELSGGYVALTMQAKDAQSGNINASNNAESNSAYVGLFARDTTISANGNTITVTQDATIAGNLAGGQAVFIAESGDALGGKAFSVTNATNLMDISGTKVLANDNVINFNGTLQSGNLYGGYTEFNVTAGDAKNYYTGTGIVNHNFDNTVAQANNNIVTIGDSAQINDASTSLYGGYLAYNSTSDIRPSSYDLFTGNTLNFSAQPVTVNTVANFEHYNFTLDPALADTGTALITANTVIFGTNADNISTDAMTSTLQVVGIHSGTVLNAGNEFMLIRADNMSGQAAGSITRGIAQQGISLLYDVETKVNSADNVVTATILDCQTGLGGACTTEGGSGGNGNGEDGNGGGNGNSGGGSAARVNPQLLLFFMKLTVIIPQLILWD